HLGVGLVLRERARLFGLAAGVLQLAVRRDDLLQLREVLAEAAETIGVRGDGGRGHLRRDRLVARLDLREAVVEVHGGFILRAAPNAPSVRRRGTRPQIGSSSSGSPQSRSS